MSHKFTFTVEVEVSRVQGKFATRDEMADQIRDALEGADPGGLYGLGPDGMTDYDMDYWDVQDA